MNAEADRKRMSWRSWAIVVCTSSGLVCSAPALWALTTYSSVGTQIGDVMLHPVGEDQAQVSVVYEIPTPQGTWVGWTQGNTWWRPDADPILPRAEAEALAADLQRPATGGRAPIFQVLYHANDPGGSAFIMIRRGLAAWGHKLGVVLVALSLMLSLPLPIWNPSSRRRA